jgi:hypothetical protein
MSFAETGKAAGHLDYALVSKSISRFGHRLWLDATLREQLSK